MRSNELTLDKVVAATFEAERTGVAHPPMETLIGYQAGDLAGAELAAVREHLSRCESCTETLLDWSDFPDSEPENPALRARSEDEAMGWRRLEERLSRTASAAVLPFEPPPPSPTPRKSSWHLASVAALMAALLGLSFWMGTRSGHSGSPRANVWAVDLHPTGERAVRGGGLGLSLPGDMSFVLFFLNGANVRDLSAFSAELLDENDAVLHRWPHLIPSTEGNFTVEFPRDALQPGDYKVHLSGREGDRRQAVAEYSFRIESTSSG